MSFFYIYHRLSATISIRKAESDSISGCCFGFTVLALTGRDPDCIQVQRWDCSILGNGNVEPILVAEKLS